MKYLFVFITLFLIQSFNCEDTSVTYREKRCEDFLSAVTCTKLRNAATRLHEKASIVHEAVKAAIAHHKTKATEMLAYIKEYMAEKVPCEKVLNTKQCNFLTNLATKFKLRAGELQRVLVESVLNGTKSAKQLYDVTIGKFIEDAKNLKCEDLIPKDTCDKLDLFAQRLPYGVLGVVVTVKKAIANGANSVTDIYNSAITLMKEKLSCVNFLGESSCNKLEKLASMLHVNFKKVTDKMRELYSNGVTSVKDIYKKVVSYVWNLFWGDSNKRSLDMSSFTDKIVQMVEKVIGVSKDVTERLRAEIQNAFAQGKVTILKFKAFVQEMIAKYGPQSDEEDALSVYQDLIANLKNALKTAHGKAKEMIEKLLTKSKDELLKLQDYIKSILGDSNAAADSVRITYDIIADIAKKELDDEVKMAEDEIDNMVNF